MINKGKKEKKTAPPAPLLPVVSGAAAQGTKRERQAHKREVDDSVFGIFKDVEEYTQLSYGGTENIWCRQRTSVWAKRPNPRFSKPHSNTPLLRTSGS